MTETLEESCCELKKVLSYVEHNCQAILTSLDEFEEYVASYGIGRLIRKLHILGSWIIVMAERLYKEHKGQGYLCVFLSEAKGLRVHWLENKEIVSDKAFFEAGGSNVLSIEEVNDIITQMMDELASGEWAEAADWFKKYGKSPGLDFSKFC